MFHLIHISSLLGYRALRPVLKSRSACQIVRVCASLPLSPPSPFFARRRRLPRGFSLLSASRSDVTITGQRRTCDVIKPNPVGNYFDFRKAEKQLLFWKLKGQVPEGNSWKGTWPWHWQSLQLGDIFIFEYGTERSFSPNIRMKLHLYQPTSNL